jgi:hypothetical protein
VFDPLTDKIYCNIEDKSEVTTIDGVKHEAIAHWPLAPEQSLPALRWIPRTTVSSLPATIRCW